MGITRAKLIARMRIAFKAGKAFNQFYTTEKGKAPVYRRTTMLTDWSNINQLVRKEGRAKFTRKGYVPAVDTAKIRVWAMSKEWMYQVRVISSLRLQIPDKPTVINIMSDKPLTVQEITQAAFELTFKQSPPKSGEERKFVVLSVIHRAEL